MARIRSLKPEAFTSLTLSQVDRGVRWTFGGLWTYCDDEGRGVWDPRLVKAAVYPLDETITPAVVADDVAQLERIGAVHLYRVAGREYVHVPSWHGHQHPNRPVPSKLPPCPHTDDALKAPGTDSAATVTAHCSANSQQEKPANTGAAAGSPAHNGRKPADHVQRTADSVSPHGALTPVVVVVDVEGDGEGGGPGEDNPTPAAPASTTKAKAKNKRTSTPESFDVTLPLRGWAKNIGFTGNLSVETEQFLDHHRAKDSTYADWTAAWRTWIRNATKWGPTKPAATAPRNGGDW